MENSSAPLRPFDTCFIVDIEGVWDLTGIKEKTMCKLQCKVEEGLILSEVVAYIQTFEGDEEEVTLASSLVVDDTVTVSLIHKEPGRSLVELPRETATGKWRIWVPNTILQPQEEAACT